MVKQKDTESESEGMMHAEEPRFRISVCMKRYYSDERARACICVSARRRVRWLHRRLRRLFALPRAFRLLSRGHLLPRDEPLALLDRDDLVEVIPMHADNDETATAQDAVDSVAVVDTEDVVACENEYNPAPSLALSPPFSPALSPPLSLAPSSASPSALLLPSWPDQPDDLMASKRRALMMVEQLYAGDARPRRRRVRRRRRAHAREPLNQSPSADDEHSKRASDDEHSQERAPTALRAPEGAAVVRNAHAPRAPRVVHPLCDAHAPSASRVVHPLCDAHAPSAPRVVHPLCDAHAPSAPASTTLPSVAHAIFT